MLVPDVLRKDRTYATFCIRKIWPVPDGPS